MRCVSLFVDHSWNGKTQTLWFGSVNGAVLPLELLDFFSKPTGKVRFNASKTVFSVEEFIYCQWFRQTSYIVSRRPMHEILAEHEGQIGCYVGEKAHDTKKVTHEGVTRYQCDGFKIYTWTLLELEQLLRKLDMSIAQMGHTVETAIRLLKTVKNGRIVSYVL